MNTAHQIVHIHLDQCVSFEPIMQPSFVVVWYKQWPLGHAWVDGAFDLFATIEKSIAFYADTTMAATIRTAISKNNGTDLSNCMDELLSLAYPEPLHLPSLSVVICTRNRTSALIKCIQSLQQSDDTNFELIIVDNAPDDDSTEKAIAAMNGVVYVKEPRKGLDYARNAGAKAASKEIVAYTDDDVEVTANWTTILKKCFINPSTMAVTGLVLPVAIQTQSQYLFEKYWSFNRGYVPIVFDEDFFSINKPFGVPVWDIGAGANMAFRKITFDLVGYFDERLDVGTSGCSGDSEFWYKVLADGWVCNYFPQLVVFHSHREDMPSLNRQLFSYMRGQVSSLLVQYEKYKHIGNVKRVFKWLPLYYWQRIKDKIKGRDIEKNKTLWLEIKGCFSGALFYLNNRKSIADHRPFPLKLNEAAVVHNNTIVSVVITCYNYGHFLKQSIDSVLQQTYKHIEIIVVDDGSTDNTQEIIASFTGIKSMITNRIDVSAARNEGIKLATGDYIVFLDADDYMPVNAVELNLYYFGYEPKAVFVSGNYQRVDIEGVKMDPTVPVEKQGSVYADLLYGNYIGMEGTIMYRKAVFDCFQFDNNFRTGEFYDLNLSIARYFPSISHRNLVAYYRIHPKSKSRDNSLMWTVIQKVLEKQKTRLANSIEEKALNEGFIYWRKILLCE